MLSSADQIRVNEINNPFTALKAASATIDDETHICIHVYTRIYVCPFDETRQSFANLIRTSDRVTGVEPFPEKIVSDCRLTRLIDNLNPLSSLIRPSNTLTSKRERSPYRIHTRFAFYASMYSLRRYLRLLILLSHVFSVYLFDQVVSPLYGLDVR